jgi:hypothetical protein
LAQFKTTFSECPDSTALNGDREATGVLDVDYKNSPTALAKPGERRRAPRFRLK